MKTYLRWKGALFAAWCFLAIGIFTLAIGIPGMVEELKLRSGGTIIQAKVTDWRLHHGRYGTNYDVRYTFPVPDRSEPYAGLWRAIPKPLWKETKRTGVLDVRYLPAVPEANRPEASSSLTDALAGILVGVLSCAMAFLFFWAIQRGWLNRDESREQPEISRMRN